MPLDIFDYQVTGSDYLTGRTRAGLHDDMGVGKTAQVIRAINNIDARRGIIVCPAAIRANWIAEFNKFSRVEYRLAKGVNIHDYVAWSRGVFHILVTGYEMATRWAQRIRDSGEVIDFVALDEGHYLKNDTSQRTRAILGPNLDGVGGLTNWTEHIWHVTGTPMANDPLDIYTFLRMCKATPLGRDQFVRRYFYSNRTVYGSRQEVRPEMQAELTYLIDNNRIKRTKAQCNIHLPPIFMTTAVVDGDTEAIKQFLLDYPGLDDAIVAAIRMGGLSFLDAQHIATLRRLVGEAKALPYSQMVLEELMASDEKRVIYGNHVVALSAIHQYLTKKGMKGILLRDERDPVEAVTRFENDPKCRFIIGNMRSAGVGLNMTAACEIDVFESDWAPAPNAQAIMRVHRLGQTRKVRARFIALAKSLDEVVTRVVAAKTAAIAQIEGEAMTAVPIDGLAELV